MEFNLGIFVAQLINFSIIFFLFKKLVGDKIVVALQERKKALAKAQDALLVYEETMRQAEDEKNAMLAEALQHKESILQEARQLAEKKAEVFFQQAHVQADNIVKKAQEHADALDKEMKDAFVDGVKKTTELVVKKLIHDDVKLQESYVEQLVREFA